MSDQALLQNGWRESTRLVNGVRLHAVEAGDPGAPLILLLHGFPEFWWAGCNWPARCWSCWTDL